MTDKNICASFLNVGLSKNSMDKINCDGKTPTFDKQLITACAFIHRNFGGEIKVFLARRADAKKFLPGNFELPGGHINLGEDISSGLKREIMEEHCMHIKVGDPFDAFTYLNKTKSSHSIEVVYFATFEDPIENIKINPKDHSEFKWVSQKEINSIGQISDEEMKSVRKGLALMNGQKPAFT
jgi:8-oxo-dGTP diphosphatase